MSLRSSQEKPHRITEGEVLNYIRTSYSLEEDELFDKKITPLRARHEILNDVFQKYTACSFDRNGTFCTEFSDPANQKTRKEFPKVRSYMVIKNTKSLVKNLNKVSQHRVLVSQQLREMIRGRSERERED